MVAGYTYRYAVVLGKIELWFLIVKCHCSRTEWKNSPERSVCPSGSGLIFICWLQSARNITNHIFYGQLSKENIHINQKDG